MLAEVKLGNTSQHNGLYDSKSPQVFKVRTSVVAASTTIHPAKRKVQRLLHNQFGCDGRPESAVTGTPGLAI